MDISKLNGSHLVTTIFEYELEDGTPAKETINTWVKKGAWSLQKQDALASGNGLQIATALADLIDRWDITEEGEPFPPTMDNIYLMQDSLLAAIGQDVIGSFAANPTRAKLSRNGLAQMAK